jgi:hypothetical protein
MLKLYSVEAGIKELPNFSRMTTSTVVLAETQAEAIRYVETHCPDVLANADIQRVTEVQHVVVNWPDGLVDIIEKHSP